MSATDGYPKGIIDLRRLAKKDGVSIEPGRKHYFVEHRTTNSICPCGEECYPGETNCEDCFIESEEASE